MSEIKRYRKKPVVIEAYQLEAPYGHNAILVSEWCNAEIKHDGKPEEYRKYHLIIHTLEGDHLAEPGDYIIKGVAGEFYPCKPDIFAQTYDEVRQWGDHDVTEV